MYGVHLEFPQSMPGYEQQVIELATQSKEPPPEIPPAIQPFMRPVEGAGSIHGGCSSGSSSPCALCFCQLHDHRVGSVEASLSALVACRRRRLLALRVGACRSRS